MADVVALADAHAPEGSTVIAEEQTAGRGRHGRSWDSARYAGLWLSLLLRPSGVPPEALGWLPLAVGIGVVRGIAAKSGSRPALKWPNDVVVARPDGVAKLAGILAERLPDGAVVVGIGINVDHRADELPQGATSLRCEAAPAPLGDPARVDVLVGVLAEVADVYRHWTSGGDLSEEYRRRCITLGHHVRMSTPGPGARDPDRQAGRLGRPDGDPDRVIAGRAEDIDDLGRLIVVDEHGSRTALAAGEVALVRPVR